MSQGGSDFTGGKAEEEEDVEATGLAALASSILVIRSNCLLILSLDLESLLRQQCHALIMFILRLLEAKVGLTLQTLLLLDILEVELLGLFL